MSFSTVEDINGAMFDNQGFWWHEINIGVIDTTDDFSNVKLDFCKVSRTKSGSIYYYTIDIDNNYFTNGFYILDNTRAIITDYTAYELISENKISFKTSTPNVYLGLYLGLNKYGDLNPLEFTLVDSIAYLNLKQLKSSNTFKVRDLNDDGQVYDSDPLSNLIVGFNNVTWGSSDAGFILVKLLKTDFQFTCNQDLTVGEVNTVQLGTLTDYKPNGDLVGEYTTKLSVLYNDKTIPVNWNAQLNDYTFDLDLTNVTEEKKIRFKVLVEANEVLSASETDVVLNANFETINTLAKLTELFRIGGTGRITSNITLNTDLTLTKSVMLISDSKTLNMASHKIVVPSDLTFKAQTVNFSNGVNTLQQEPNSTVELTDCSFTGCTGFGSVIDCQIDINSLNDEDDFRTILTRCNISNSDMMILHGGHLEINECVITGKVGNKNYPYCLYQADGNASIRQTEFSLIDDTVYDYDLLFNPCIFTVGETATINGLGHNDLQRNNVTALLGDVRNTSIVDLTYHYNLIEDTINLKATNGFCHNVSGEDFVFKTNIQLTRG